MEAREWSREEFAEVVQEVKAYMTKAWLLRGGQPGDLDRLMDGMVVECGAYLAIRDALKGSCLLESALMAMERYSILLAENFQRAARDGMGGNEAAIRITLEKMVDSTLRTAVERYKGEGPQEFDYPPTPEERAGA